MQFPHDKEAFEAYLLKTMPDMKLKAARYFAKSPDGEYLWPEANLGYLCFKLGGNYACDALEARLIQPRT